MHRPLTNQDWLLAYLAANGPSPKNAVLAAWRRAFPGRPSNSLEVAFSRAKRRGLVTGEVLRFQGPSVWRLLEPGESSEIWTRWRGPVRRRPVSVVRNGVYSPPWGSAVPTPEFWASTRSPGPSGSSEAQPAAPSTVATYRPEGPTDEDLRRLARERALARLAFG